MSSKIASLLLILLLSVPVSAQDESEKKALKLLDRCNVVWDSPSDNAWGSMPLGNGDIGVNFWVEPNGDFIFYISKSDAWSESSALLKLGRVRVKFDPVPVMASQPFVQELDLRNGEIRVKSGENDNLKMRMWIDMHNPVIAFECNSDVPVKMQVDFETWRTERRELVGIEKHLSLGGTAVIEPDIILEAEGDQVMWCHRNTTSFWDYDKKAAEHPELNIPKLEDPFLNRTFGGLIDGPDLEKVSSTRLVSVKPRRENNFNVYVLTAKTDTIEQWQDKIKDIRNNLEETDTNERIAAHRKWWRDFWVRSWILIDGNEKARTVGQVYNLQRYMNAIAGRGEQPIKFNGSLFTMPVLKDFPQYELAAGEEADFRLWGPMYWWQNTRLIYWTMIQSGDFDLLKTVFKMYVDMLPLFKARTQLHYNHPGAVFLEVNPWYGPNFTVKPTEKHSHTTFYNQSGLEIAAMMLDYCKTAGDNKFLTETAIPFCNEILVGYWEHFEKDENGKLYMYPAQSLETYWDVVNPTPEIAGLKYITDQLLSTDQKYVTQKDRQFWEKISSATPEIPTRIVDGVEIISPAKIINDPNRHNWESPELYAIFPYRQFGLGRKDLEMAHRTYEMREEKRTGGWFYAGIMAALLGLDQEAAEIVHTNFTVENAVAIGHFDTPDEYRFPAFLGPNCDWVPDQDQPSVAMIALQRMVMQQVDDKILLLGAWPKDWDVFFKLHARNRTVVTGEYKKGKLQFDVDPKSQLKGVHVVID